MGLLCLSVCVVTSILVFAGTSQSKNTCATGQFKLSGMKQCQNWLDCSDLEKLKLGKIIGVGSTKVVYVASWNGLNVASSQLLNDNFKADFDHGLEMLQKYSPNQYIVQLIGFCKKQRMIVTEYHEFGNATAILSIVNNRYGSENIIARLKLCLNYARILEVLHDGPAGVRVMCDSNDLGKLLSQMLITDDVGFVLNDLDALPLVDKDLGSKVKCGNRELYGEFVAPEQKWPFNGPFKEAAMPHYDEKTDIWKAADVFKHFLSNIDVNYEWVHYRLFNLYRSCKNSDPNVRPSAKYLASVLDKILAEVISLKTEL